jgi:tetratricopeptide (TPR) repeat protein
MNRLPQTVCQPNKKFDKISGYSLVIFLLVLWVTVIYSNTMHSSWHLDDYANIQSNPRVLINDLKPGTLWQTFFASPEGKRKPYRSLAFLSFALNAFVHRTNVLGYHIVNITIHVLTTLLLFATVLALMKTPVMRGISRGHAFITALLTAALWAVNPIHTQAVTYIVQRMASLAAMFYLLSVYLYITARLKPHFGARLALFTLCGLSYVCAIFSKENAALLPMILLLAEFIFFRDLSEKRVKIAFGLCLTAGGLFVLLLGMTLFGNPFSFFRGYPFRTFTPIERLLTEARVLVLYLSQIFYPIPGRLSIYHDISVSTSVFHPWTTLPSIGLILALVFLGFYWMGRRPLLSFAILFFFINHLIESSVIGLELVYEHRNYLPSLFIFMPVSFGFKKILENYQVSNPPMRRFLVAAIILTIISLGTGTFIRNRAWANERSLWEDALRKAPGSIRAHHELAFQYYEKQGLYDEALALYHRGLNLKGQNVYEKTRSLNNIASIHFTRGNYREAEKYFKLALEAFPRYDRIYYRLSLTQTRLGKWQDASKTLANVISQKPPQDDVLRLKGIILLYEGKPGEAVNYFRACLKLDPADWQNLLNVGAALTMQGSLEQGYNFMAMAEAARPTEPLVHLMLANNRMLVGEETTAERHLDHFIERVGPSHALEYLRLLVAQNRHLNMPIGDIQSNIRLKISQL